MQNQWLYWIIVAMFCCCNWYTSWNWYNNNYSFCIDWWPLVTDRNFVTSQYIVIFDTLLSEYTLLCVSRIAAYDFIAKWCLRMNIHSAPECTMFAPAQLLCNWHEQRPSSKGDLDLSVMEEVGRVCCIGLDLLQNFFCCSLWLSLDCILSGIPHTSIKFNL